MPYRNVLARLLLVCLFVLVSSCGGGSDGGETPDPITPTPTIITGTPQTSVNEIENYSFSVSASGFTNASLVYSIENKPDWANFDSATGELSGTPSYDDAGVYEDIRVSASDGTNSESLSSFSIIVADVNRLPILSSAKTYIVNENNGISAIIDISDADGDEATVTFNGLPDWLEYFPEYTLLEGLPTERGLDDITIEIVINDGTVSISEEILLSFITDDGTWFEGKSIDHITSSDEGLLYLSVDSEKLVTFDPSLNIVMDIVNFSGIESLLYHNGHQQLYFFHSGSGKLQTLSGSLAQNGDPVDIDCITNLTEADEFLIATDCEENYRAYHVIDSDGNVVSVQEDLQDISIESTWEPIQKRLYHLDNSTPSRNIFQRTLSEEGYFTSYQYSDSYYDDTLQGPIVASPDGAKIILASGAIFDAENLIEIGLIPESFNQVIWLEDDTLLLIVNNDTSTLIKRLNLSYETIESTTVEGSFVFAEKRSGEVLIITNTTTGLNAHYLVPSNDADNDGVVNIEDAFPADSAASIDNDFDGFPDSWNDGYSAADSTTGLTIDYFPLDGACWLSEHALEGNSLSCDYNATMPIFEPSQVLNDDSGNIYLLNAQNNTVYRWLKESEGYGNPIYLNKYNTIANIRYSSSHERLYVLYEDIGVHYVDLTSLDVERTFLNNPNISTMEVTGNYLLVNDTDDNRLYTYDDDAIKIDEDYYSYDDLDGFIYDDVNGVGYYSQYNNRLFSLPISVLGFFGYDSYAYNDSVSYSPLRLSANLSSLLSVSGYRFNIDELSEPEQVLPEAVIDLQYLQNEVITINSGNSLESSTVGFYHTNNFKFIADFNVSGAPVAILSGQNEAALVTFDSEVGVEITIFDLADDDDDGLSNYVEINLLESDSLLADTDEDGLPDLYEFQNALLINTNDASDDADSDNLSNIDEYTNGTDIHVSDSDNDGLTDGEEVHTYLTSATSRDTDNDGMPDGWEITQSFDPLSSADATVDSDSDGYSNLKEFYLDSDPSDISDIPEIKAWNSYQGNSDNTGFVAIDIDMADLTFRWSTTLPDSSYISSSGVVATQGKVFATYVNADNDHIAAALNSVNGLLDWQSNKGNLNSISSASFNNDNIYFQTVDYTNAYLYALNIDDGTEVFASEYVNNYSTSRGPTVHESEVFVTGGNGNGTYKFDAETGGELWHSFETLFCSGVGHAVDTENVYHYDGDFKVLSKSTGSVIAASSQEGYTDCRTPVLGINNNAIVVTNNGLTVFDKTTAGVLWQIENGDGSLVFSGVPAIALGKIYTHKGGVLTVFDEFSGEELWSWEPNASSLQNNIAVSMNLVFVSDYYNTYAIDINTHEQVWSYPVNGEISLSLEGALYIEDSDGSITAINISGDTDEDGIYDWWEELYGLNPNDDTDAVLNGDTDALTNLEEYLAGTNPLLEDSDNDGINDSDEVNTYFSNPISSDTDGDGMPDLWEVNQGFDLLNSYDALLDADNDTVSNADEYTLATDPNDASSLPDIISSLNFSFEDGVIPSDWVVDQTLVSAWGVTAQESSDGSNSIFSSGEAAISFSGYFGGNSLSFDMKSDCTYYDIYVYVDDELSASFDLSSSWQTVTTDIAVGQHDIKIKTPNCNANYLDNITISPLDSIFNTDTFMVTTDYSLLLKFFDIEGELIKQVNIPEVDDYNDARDLVVLSDGRVAVFNGTYSPSLSIYTPEQHKWQHLTDDEWGVDNSDSYGGIAAIDNKVFVTNMVSSVNNSSGIIQIDLTTNIFTYIDGEEFVDLTIGLDDYLYGMTSSAVYKYNIDTLELEDITVILPGTSLAVDDEGNIYIASSDGTITQYNAAGLQTKSISVNDITSSNYVYINLQDININGYGELFITNTSQQIFITDIALDNIDLYFESDSREAEFLTLLPFIDNDEDGMPNWWENKYGLSDEDATDATSDLDDEGINNLDEYLAKLDPSKADTDDDTLNDFFEINSSLTDPLLADTDSDGLDDASELNVHLTDPLDADSDDDLFSDGDEVNYYLTDPLDADSVPELDLIAFNTDVIPSTFTNGSGSNADWYIDDGTLRSGEINDSEVSSIVYSKTFSSGILTFDALVSSESCCDKLEVNLDGEQVIYSSEQEFTSYSIELTAGEHSLTFSYTKDSSVTSGDDAVWIDNLLFTPRN